MLDSYWIGNVQRISPEAPVPVFLKRSNRTVLGGSANVVANLLSAGQKVMAASIIGLDKTGDHLMELLSAIGSDNHLMLRKAERKTTIKTRILAQNNQQLLRIDDEDIRWMSSEEEDSLVDQIEKEIVNIDAIIISDYMKGIVRESFCQRIIQIAKKRKVPVYCDVKDPKVEKYKNATLIKPNRNELKMLSGMPVDTKDEIYEACKTLCHRCNNEYILVTLGSKGMALFCGAEDSIQFIMSEPREVYDVSGAGDTVISYLVACITSGIEINEAVRYANKAAGIKVGKVGTSTVSLEEMKEEIRREQLLKASSVGISSKIQNLSGLLKVLHNSSNKKIVFTNGCFDILHAGHVMYLQKAAECGDVLIVGVNSDESIRRLKGSNRPVNTLKDRLAVLAGLQSVDYIVPFSEDTPEELIQTIKPDVLVKGSDYEGKSIAGADYVKAQGGAVVLIPLLEGHSTTNIIKKSAGE